MRPCVPRLRTTQWSVSNTLVTSLFCLITTPKVERSVDGLQSKPIVVLQIVLELNETIIEVEGLLF